MAREKRKERRDVNFQAWKLSLRGPFLSPDRTDCLWVPKDSYFAAHWFWRWVSTGEACYRRNGSDLEYQIQHITENVCNASNLGDAFCELCQPCIVQIGRIVFNFGLLPSNRQTFSQENSMIKKTYFPRLADVAFWHNCLGLPRERFGRGVFVVVVQGLLSCYNILWKYKGSSHVQTSCLFFWILINLYSCLISFPHPGPKRKSRSMRTISGTLKYFIFFINTVLS